MPISTYTTESFFNSVSATSNIVVINYRFGLTSGVILSETAGFFHAVLYDRKDLLFSSVLLSEQAIYFDAIKRYEVPYYGEFYFVSPELFKYIHNRKYRGNSFSVKVPPDNIVRLLLIRNIFKDSQTSFNVVAPPNYIRARIVINNSTEMIVDNIDNADIVTIKPIDLSDLQVKYNYQYYMIEFNLNKHAKKGDNVQIYIYNFNKVENVIVGEFIIDPIFTEENVVVGSAGGGLA